MTDAELARLIMDAVPRTRPDLMPSPRELALLVLLADGPRYVTNVAVELGIAQSSASELVQVGLSSGRVETERVPNPSGRGGPSTMVRLSPKGAQTMRRRRGMNSGG